jgi:hypothetical protein
MREPPTRVRVIGHPVVAVPICGLCALALYGCIQNPDAWILGVGALIGLAWSGKAMETMKRYRDWQRAWDSMAEPVPVRPAGPRIAKALSAGAIIAGFAASEAGFLSMGSGSGPAMMGIIALAAIILGAVVLRRNISRRVARRRATVAVPAVAIRVAKPVLPVPALTDAYRALPEHCWDVLGR